jgi:hypothetical protein
MGGKTSKRVQERFCAMPEDSSFRSAGFLWTHPPNCQNASESAHFIPKFTKNSSVDHARIFLCFQSGLPMALPGFAIPESPEVSQTHYHGKSPIIILAGKLFRTACSPGSLL